MRLQRHQERLFPASEVYLARSYSLASVAHISLARRKSDQSLVTISGDGDNSLSMRWVKFGSRASMNHAAGAGGG